MNITIVGPGNVGGSLAVAFLKAGHSVLFGVKDKNIYFKGKELADQFGFSYLNIDEAVSKSEIIVISVPAQFAADVAKGLGNVSDKIIIDTMNSAFIKPGLYNNTADAILANCNCTNVVKCFNTTGFENLADPIYKGEGIDMFMAGSSVKAKKIAQQLSKEIGFANCFDFGGNENFYALEQLAFAWINLAILQKHGRDLAFKLIKR